ncbi:MAG TPA: PQQ-binding-like beta-propeller repeat protein [Candidatus Bathyarchaeia archaeon]|nr:PQQ-binding-like beta-propeller repeat protein [Candidatus Bathyarchaeia archaeon]
MKKPSFFIRAGLLFAFTLIVGIATAADREPSPEEISHFIQELILYSPRVTDLAIFDNTLFLSWGRVGRESEGSGVTGLQILDIKDPAAPKLLWSEKGTDTTFTLVIEENRAFIAGDSKMEGRKLGCLKVLNIEDPSSPELLGKVEFEEEPLHLAVANGVACVAGYTKLIIIDLNDIAAPRVVASHEEHMPPKSRFLPRFIVGLEVHSHYYIYGLAIDGSHVYVGSNRVLYALDISTLSAPQNVGLYKINGWVTWLLVENGIACVGVAHHKRTFPFSDIFDVGSRELILLDVKDLKNPRLLKKVKVPKGALEYGFSAGIVYASDSDKVYAYDVRDAWSSQKKPLPVTSSGAVNKETLVIPSGGGCKIFDIKEPLSPRLITTYQVKED